MLFQRGVSLHSFLGGADSGSGGQKQSLPIQFGNTLLRLIPRWVESVLQEFNL